MIWKILQEVMQLLDKENFWEDGGSVGYDLPDGKHHLFIYANEDCDGKFITIEANEIIDGAHEPLGSPTTCAMDEKEKFVVELAWVLESQCNIDDYNKGMNDAWEIAKKIALPENDGGMSLDDIRKIFSSIRLNDILKVLTPQEAKSKIAAWELARQEIKVGDVVMDTQDDVFVVLKELSCDVCSLINSKGEHKAVHKKHLAKTGRSIDIASVLKQIGG